MKTQRYSPIIFQERLREEIKKSGLTGKEIALAAGIDRKCITAYKYGDYIPNIVVFMKICKILNVSADYMLGLTNERKTI